MSAGPDTPHTDSTVDARAIGDVHMVNPSARRVRVVAGQASGPASSKRRPWFRRSVRTGGIA